MPSSLLMAFKRRNDNPRIANVGNDMQIFDTLIPNASLCVTEIDTEIIATFQIFGIFYLLALCITDNQRPSSYQQLASSALPDYIDVRSMDRHPYGAIFEIIYPALLIRRHAEVSCIMGTVLSSA